MRKKVKVVRGHNYDYCCCTPVAPTRGHSLKRLNYDILGPALLAECEYERWRFPRSLPVAGLLRLC